MIVEVVTLFLLVVVVVVLAVTTAQLRRASEVARVNSGRQVFVLQQLEKTLERMEAATKVVAVNLSDSVSRADHADDSIPGSSADAALRTGNDRYDNPRS